MTEKDQGFSLVEVLVCIAILAIISIPLLASMRTSAKLNYDANYTQKLTAYAQQELERIKSLPTQQYVEYITSQGGSKKEVVDDTVYSDAYTRAQSYQASFSGAGELDAETLKELFTPFYMEQEHIAISGKEYTMRALFEPAPYSRENIGDDSFAQDINVALLADVTEADASRFPVISDEINQYDGTGSGTSAVVSNIKTKLEAIGTSAVEEDIAKGMEKDAVVDITTSGNEVMVTCDVTYSYGTVELYYRVYTGTYAYWPTKSEIDAGTANGMDLGEQTGGSVFIFARAFQDTAFSVEESAHCINKITINNNCDAEMPVDVYLVRGYQKGVDGKKIDYNFDSVSLNGTEYLTGTPTGESGIGAGRFYTNIKSARWNRCEAMLSSEDDAEKETIVGKGEYEARCYDVTIELLEETDSGKELKARIGSTKVEK